MTENNNNTAVMEVGLGEISTIRDILMGQHINQYESQFQQMQNEIKSLKQQLEQKIEEVDKFHKLGILDLRKDNDQRFGELEKLISENVGQLEHQINTVSATDKKELGKMLSQIGEKLMK